MYREVLTFLGQFTASGALPAVNFADESLCLLVDNIWNEVVNNLQITGGVENAVPLHVDIPSTSVEIPIYCLKLFYGNICNFPMNTFFSSSVLGLLL
jgi:hypothetical protein